MCEGVRCFLASGFVGGVLPPPLIVVVFLPMGSVCGSEVINVALCMTGALPQFDWSFVMMAAQLAVPVPDPHWPRRPRRLLAQGAPSVGANVGAMHIHTHCDPRLHCT